MTKKLWTHKKYKGKYEGKYTYVKGERVFQLICTSEKGNNKTYESFQAALKLGWRQS